MSNELACGHAELASHLNRSGQGGTGRSVMQDAGNCALAALKAAMTKAGVPAELRPEVIGHFCNEWNAGVATGAIQL